MKRHPAKIAPFFALEKDRSRIQTEQHESNYSTNTQHNLVNNAKCTCLPAHSPPAESRSRRRIGSPGRCHTRGKASSSISASACGYPTDTYIKRSARRLHGSVLTSRVQDVVPQEVNAKEVGSRVHDAAERQLDGVRSRIHQVVAVLRINQGGEEYTPIRDGEHAAAETALQTRDLLHIPVQRGDGTLAHQVPRLHRLVLAPRKEEIPRGIAGKRRDRQAVRRVVLRLTASTEPHMDALALLVVPDLDGSVKPSAEQEVRHHGMCLLVSERRQSHGDAVDVVVVGGQHDGLRAVDDGATLLGGERPHLHHPVRAARDQRRVVGVVRHVPDDALVLADARRLV